MNDMTLHGGTAVTMTSREIAELTGKQHAHVMRDIRAMLEALEKDVSSFGSIFQDAYGRDQQEFRLPKDLTLTLVTGYDVKRRHAINVRWMELEARQADPMQVLNDPAAMRGLLLTYTEKVIALESKVKEDAPKVDFAMAVRRMEGTCKIGDFCKAIGYGRNTLFQKLRDDGILMRDNRPYQRYIDNGLMDVIENDPFTDKNGKAHPTFTPVVTGKGQVWLEKKYRRDFVVKAVAA